MTLELVDGQTIGSLPHGERRKVPDREGSKLSELDLSAVDMRAITPEEREAVMREAARQGEETAGQATHAVADRSAIELTKRRGFFAGARWRLAARQNRPAQALGG